MRRNRLSQHRPLDRDVRNVADEVDHVVTVVEHAAQYLWKAFS